MPRRFIFRQVDYRDFQQFINDGSIKAINSNVTQPCHQTSYRTLVNRRGSNVYNMPCGGVVNDYVPFYFSPITSYTYTISQGNVTVVSPNGVSLGQSNEDQRIFFVGSPERIHTAGLTYCFSNIALNASAPIPIIEQDISNLEKHINWPMFDDTPLKGAIPEIQYQGACQYFKDAAEHGRMNRSKERMAEFLIRNEVPLNLLDCIIVKSADMRDTLEPIINASGLGLPIYINKGCYWR